MNILLLGASGFIGTNLAKALRGHSILLVDRKMEFFDHIKKMKLPNVSYILSDLAEPLATRLEPSCSSYIDKLLKGQDVVYHLVSTTVPTTSNQHIVEELKANILFSANLFEACVRQKVKKVIFISSGGTVYGKESSNCPLNEDTPTNPITSYGVQKLTIEKLLYLYHHMYGLDYRIIRLSNPYGPYQRPNGILGAVTTFTYKALMNEEINVYGDGSIIRDFIYIDDAIKGILNIVQDGSNYRIYNLGSGYGTSIKKVIETIEKVLNLKLKVQYTEARAVDVPINFLNIERYEREYGKLNPISLAEGIKRTANFMREFYDIRRE